MKNKIIPILLISLLTCIIVSGCGKRKKEKNVESLISEIGDVTLESKESIKAAEEAYNSLTDDEKEQVENRTELQDKKNELSSLQQKDLEEKLKQREEEKERQFEPFKGIWKSLYANLEDKASIQTHEISLTSYPRQKGVSSSDSMCQVVDETHIIIDNLKYELIEVDGIQVLTCVTDDFKNVFVRKEDFDALTDKMFVHVELDDDNIDEYFGGIEIVGEFDNTDAFGEERDTSAADAYMISSKAYKDKGLIMLTYQDVTYEVYFDGFDSPGTFTDPYIITTGTGNPRINHYGRAKGEIWYVKKEYVDKIEDGKEYYQRNITFKDGYSFLYYVPTPYKLNFSVADLEF